MPGLTWADADEIGYQLSEQHPDMDPLTVRFTDLRDMVMSLEGFSDASQACSEGVLEAIQMAWMEYAREG